MDAETEDDERSSTDIEEIEEMLYCTLYHERRTTESKLLSEGEGIQKNIGDENQSIKEDCNNDAIVEDSSYTQEASHNKTGDSSKEIITVGVSSESEEDTGIECLGSFSKEGDGNQKNTAKSSLCDDEIPRQSTQISLIKPKGHAVSVNVDRGISNTKESGLRTNDLEEGEILGDSDSSTEVEFIGETCRQKDLEDGELDSDVSVKAYVPVVNLESEKNEVIAPSEKESVIKANFSINVECSTQPTYDVSSTEVRWSDCDTESSLSDDSDTYTGPCPNLTTLSDALDGSLPTDLSNSDSEISEAFSVAAIQETMPDCCWKISKEDRYPERRLFTDDLIKCSICESRGHWKYDCPELLQSRACQYCGKRGHRAPTSLAHCPNAVCVLCWAKGHVEQQCPRQWIKKNVCDLCNNTGHTGMQCPHWWNGYYDQDGTDSEDSITKATEKKQKKLFCCNCGEEGHCYENCNLPHPTYDDYWPFTGASSDSEDEVRIVKPSKIGDSFVWSLNICPTDEKRAGSPSNATKLTFRDFLKSDSKLWFSGTKKRTKTFQNMLKEARLKRKRQKKHRRERKKLELIYGKVGQNKGAQEKCRVRKKKKASVEGEGRKVRRRNHRKRKMSLSDALAFSEKHKFRRSRPFSPLN